MGHILPKLLHKHLADDVLLTDPLKVLPGRFVSQATSKSNDPVINTLNSLYIISENNEYVLRMPVSSDEKLGLSFGVVLDEAKNEKMRAVPHQVLAELAETLPSDSSEYLDYSDKAITAFLEHHGVERHSSSFQFINDADHYFFYRKPHEHVPGIMLLEAARQAIYYQLYTHSDHELGKVTVSLSELKATFFNYAELMYPIEVVIDDLTATDTLKPKEVLYSVSFCQRGRVLARVDSLAPVIALKRFQLARNARLFDDEDRFSPVTAAPITALLTHANGEQSLISLNEVSLNGCNTSNPSVSLGDEGYVTVLYGNKLHFHTKASCKFVTDRSVEWVFDKVSFEQKELLREIIKRGFISSSHSPR
ncbi:hypothetical protein CWB96_13865 [Pseudoalteromonas citrea]|uniref:A-factor biosynthesis hotdog domain-containing protein n=1 Tax=Pseudoalteromonas citrea TaxID=43655 RepID=A0A5S3XPG3_9GAMM|nr:AfsA-related hotdog domain-containing protein [Pseudoalteromonas citrea]TMP39176.1 hypothetical protein CWB97_20820 [Pseudoalteromonas citrea]TMP57159.1 hypothetical protein CWB96_13865 [Pseudoalteromonas citrea]